MKKPASIVAFVVAVLLFCAILPLPYGYYTFLRLTTCLGGLFLAHELYKQQQQNTAILLIGIALLFNPIIPVHLSRGIWFSIDIMSAMAFLHARGQLEKGAV